jgi:hypothetical protein
MAIRTGTPARDEARHWLPSQGVDPAPLAELNAECLGLLAMRAAEEDSSAPLPPLLAALRAHWASLSAQAVRRLAAAPFTLFDAGFASAPRWLELRPRRQRSEPLRAGVLRRCCGAFGHSSHAGVWLASHAVVTRRMPGIWCPAAAVESLAACSLTPGRLRTL